MLSATAPAKCIEVAMTTVGVSDDGHPLDEAILARAIWEGSPVADHRAEALGQRRMLGWIGQVEPLAPTRSKDR